MIDHFHWTVILANDHFSVTTIPWSRHCVEKCDANANSPQDLRSPLWDLGTPQMRWLICIASLRSKLAIWVSALNPSPLGSSLDSHLFKRKSSVGVISTRSVILVLLIHLIERSWPLRGVGSDVKWAPLSAWHRPPISWTRFYSSAPWDTQDDGHTHSAGGATIKSKTGNQTCLISTDKLGTVMDLGIIIEFSFEGVPFGCLKSGRNGSITFLMHTAWSRQIKLDCYRSVHTYATFELHLELQDLLCL